MTRWGDEEAKRRRKNAKLTLKLRRSSKGGRKLFGERSETKCLMNQEASLECKSEISLSKKGFLLSSSYWL